MVDVYRAQLAKKKRKGTGELWTGVWNPILCSRPTPDKPDCTHDVVRVFFRFPRAEKDIWEGLIFGGREKRTCEEIKLQSFPPVA